MCQRYLDCLLQKYFRRFELQFLIMDKLNKMSDCDQRKQIEGDGKRARRMINAAVAKRVGSRRAPRGKRPQSLTMLTTQNEIHEKEKRRMN